MLSWLRKTIEFYLKPRTAPRAGTGVRVSFDDDDIRVRRTDGEMQTLAWQDLVSVTILTTDTGPFDTDLYWVLTPRDRQRTLMIPMGSDGEHELLHTMQERLQNFDNIAVIDAMGSTDNASFPVWEAASGTIVRRSV